MKAANILLVILFLSFFSGLHAQVSGLNWQWARSSKGGNVIEVYDVATDRGGNAIIAGWTENDSVSFGPYTIYNSGSTTTNFLVKYSPAGQVLWAFTQPGANMLNFSNVAADTAGNAFTYGLGYNRSIYMMKVSSSGSLLWLDSSMSIANRSGDVATDPAGNAYFTGAFGDSVAIFGTDTLKCYGFSGLSYHYFVVKYSATGALLWAATVASGRAQSQGSALATDPGGNLLVGGNFNGDSLRIGGIDLHSSNPRSSGNSFVAKYNASGTVLWARALTGKYTLLSDVCTDPSGNVYAYGKFSDSLFIDNTLLIKRPTADQNFFVVKMGPSGNVIWARASYKLNPTGTGSLSTSSITIDAGGLIYLSGGGNDSLFWRNDSVFYASGGTSFVVDRSFLLSLDSSGHLLCGQNMKYGGDDASGLAVDPVGNIYWAGDYYDSVFVIGTDTLRSKGGHENGFLARFSPCGEIKGGIETIAGSVSLSLQPNPSNGAATVSFTLPDGASNSSLHITDLLGKEINGYILHDSQTEKLIDTRSMSNGIYLVSLIADGRVVAVQKMVVE